MHERSLLNSLVLLLVVSTFAALAIVGGTALLVRLPQITGENHAAVQRGAEQLAERVELILNALEGRLQILGKMIESLPIHNMHALLDTEVGEGSAFDAVYVIAPNEYVEAVGVGVDLRRRRAELLGSDLSANLLYLTARERGRPTWSDKFLSALSGNVTLGFAVPVGERMVIGEISLEHLLRTVRIAQGSSDLLVWVIDSRGEVVADTASPANVGLVNLLGEPVVRAALQGDPLPGVFRYKGRPYYPAAAHSASLDWHFFVRMPAGLHNERVRGTVILVLMTLLGSLLMGVVLAPFWAGRMVGPVRAIIDRARRVAEGSPPGNWPRGSVVEFNQLSGNLERMAEAIREREKKLQAIFNASPVPMAVSTPRPGLPAGKVDYVVVEVNDAWVEQFRRQRTEVIGRSGAEIGIWRSPEERKLMLDALNSGEDRRESWLVRGDGSELLCEVVARQVDVGGKSLLILSNEDITEQRRAERALRELNVELEARVVVRTQDLAHANRELSKTLQHLQHAQSDLVRAEKLAALGALVAGVAHELNTPLGNGLMAATSVKDQLGEMRAKLAAALPSSESDRLVEYLDTGLDITVHNLRRAAELVTSFKQVAVDRTSSQRRVFDLRSLVDEILLTLQPTLKRTPFKVEVEIAGGLNLDSYPGPLGQALANLVNNAVIHGLEGRSAGSIRISAERAEDSRIRLAVADDGWGIAEPLLGRIFDPFVTSRMGSGGTGLGLHVVHNAVTNVLGGSVSVRSQPDEGTVFEMLLPDCAPYATVAKDEDEATG